ncbi:uncharacterized protein LOC110031769 [Phalaenopsis equestris]|uniref:uncharacterized protein LOC110031769 n=1 Tax=Phalaenopsis equestris TaxID=78828 RepID=UPI0009E2E476|nr:uncharacterized protein LOC110031769 [Phalaenopsis equestris]
MGRGGKVVCKRSAGRPKKKNHREEDEDDESYVAEEEGSSFESDGSNGESFDASEVNTSASSAAEEEEIPNAKPKSRRGYYSGRRRSKLSDYEDLEDEDYEEDEDFSPDATDNEDLEEDSLALVEIRGFARAGATKQGGRKFKRKASNPKVNRRSSKVASEPVRRKRMRAEASSDDEDSFIVKGRTAVKRLRKDSKKVSKRTVKSRSARKKRSSIHSDSFDSDFLTSDDDLSAKVRVEVDSPKNKKRTKPVRRKKKLKVDSETSDSDFVVSNEDLLDNDIAMPTMPRKVNRTERKNAKTSRKQPSVESDCTDSDYEVSENEVKDLKTERVLNMRKNEGRSGKKGKEKETVDIAKQLCGICLSEEQKGTIQGILNCCSHYFCFYCIMEWSKVESRCPLCKRRFFTITKCSRSDPMLEIRRPVIRVQMRDQVYQPSEEELRVLLDPYEDVVCMECHQGGDDSLMLLCDICDSSAHSYCVGLGNEVPEGNWYCDCCKLADEGSLHSQVLDTQGASSSHTHGGVEDTCSRNFQSSSIFQRSVSSQGQSSSQRFDLNVPPRNFIEENGVVSASQASGAGASTLSSRRALHQRIRNFLSNNRARQLFPGSSRTDTSLHTDAVHSVSEQREEQLERLNSLCTVSVTEQRPERSRGFSHSNSDLVPFMSNEGRTFRHVDGAKEQIQSMVKSCLNRMPRAKSDICCNNLVKSSVYTKIARKATHTILAACGIQHCSAVVSSSVHPPDKCQHSLGGGPVNLLTGCCSSCLGDYVKDAVKMIVETF